MYSSALLSLIRGWKGGQRERGSEGKGYVYFLEVDFSFFFSFFGYLIFFYFQK